MCPIETETWQPNRSSNCKGTTIIYPNKKATQQILSLGNAIWQKKKTSPPKIKGIIPAPYLMSFKSTTTLRQGLRESKPTFS